MKLSYKDTLTKSNVFQKILSDLKAARLKHCYLILSPDDTARVELADLLTAAMYCHRGSACLECAGCRSVLSRTNADAHFFEDALKAKEADQIAAGAIERPYGGGYKTFIIFNFDKVTEEAQNKLLKTLEEPSADTVFLLFASSPAGVVSTVLSRSEVIEAAPADTKALKADLQKNFPLATESELEIAVYVSGGNITGAQRFLSDQKYRCVVDFAYKILTGLQKSAQILDFVVQAESYKNMLKELLAVLALAVRDVLAYKNGGSAAVLNKSRLDDIINVAGQFSDEACVKIIDRLNKICEGLYFNAHYISVIDQALFSYLEVKALCR